MEFFKKEKKELTQAEYDSQMRALEMQIARETKMLELEIKKADLNRIKSRLDDENKRNSKFGKFFSTIGELGGNMNKNLDREHKAKGNGLNLDHKGLTAGLPGMEVKDKKISKSKDSIAANPDFSYTGLTDGLPGIASKKRSRKA